MGVALFASGGDGTTGTVGMASDGIVVYLDAGWTRPVWRACRARSGRDWMLNSGVLRLDHRRPSRRTHAVSAAIVAACPLWLWLGYRHARR